MGSARHTLFALSASTIVLIAGAGCAMLPSAPRAPRAPSTPSAPVSIPAPHPQWTFVVVRHAERAEDGTDDPALTEAGTDRARRLAERLAPAAGVGVYATAYRRTQATAIPTARAWNVPVTTYDGGIDATRLLAEITQQHSSGTILIVGHADTVPAIVGQLCGCEVGLMEEDDFDHLYKVALAADGSVVRVEQTGEF